MTTAERLRELVRYRELVANLTIRDLKLKYKRSTLGVAWSLLNPVLMMAIYTAVFSVFLRFVSLRSYWALALIGVLAWAFFANALVASAVTFSRNPNLITKVYFPIEALPISTVLANFAQLVISVAALVVVLLVARLPLGPSLVLLPVILLAQLALTTGLAILLASVTVYFRDLEHFVAIGMTALFYVSPVIYPLDPRGLPSGAVQYIPYFKLNPLSWYLESYHSVLYWGSWPDPLLFGLMLASAALVLGAGYAVFLRLRARLPEDV